MASAIVPEIQQKYGRRRALSWRIIVGFACFTLLWWVSQPGVLFRTGSTGTAAVASQPTGTEPTQLTNEPTTTGHESVSEKHADGHKDPVAEVLLAISIPASESGDSGDKIVAGNAEEVGGAHGLEALKRLQNVVRRVADQWRPASSDSRPSTMAARFSWR